MSFLFENGEFRGDFGAVNTTEPPFFVGLFMKLTAHPNSVDYALAHGPTEAAAGPASLTTGASPEYRFSANGANSSTYSDTGGDLPGTWFAWGGLATLTNFTVYINGTAGTTSNNAPTTGNRYINIGRSLTSGSVFNPARIAEVVICQFQPTTQQIADWSSGISPNTVWSGRTDYFYYPLDTTGTTQTDASGNGGPSLTAAGTVTFDGADHPTITGATLYLPVVSPLYYGATLLANKTGIEWSLRAGHDNLIGESLGAGTAATTDASGNLQIPSGEYGGASDPVTLSLYWEEGSSPVVDRSLIVKTTLVAE